MASIKVLTSIACFVVISWIERTNGLYFYEHPNSGGLFYRAPPGWAGGHCNNVEKWINDKVSSMNTEDQCVILYEHGDCRGQEVRLFKGSCCHDNLAKIGMDDKVSSYKSC